MECPIHKTKMMRTHTQYGNRYDCTEADCDMVGWNSNTPANQQTRNARIKAHDMFDTVWRTGIMKRSEAYDALASYMGRKKKHTHMAQFSYDECQSVIVFVHDLLEDPLE